MTTFAIFMVSGSNLSTSDMPNQWRPQIVMKNLQSVSFAQHKILTLKTISTNCYSLFYLPHFES